MRLRKMYVLRQCQRALEGVSSEWSFCAGAAVGALFAPAALFLCLLLPRSRALWAAAGTVLFLLFQAVPRLWEPPSFEESLKARPAAVEYEIKLSDLRLSGVPGLEQPEALRARVVRLSLTGSKEPLPCRGEVTVFSSYPLPRRYGAVVTGKGALLPPETPEAAGRWILLTDSWKLKGFEADWRSYVLKLRDRLLSRLCSSIKDDTDRNLAAAFFFGTTGGMTPERRRDFAAAGTIHLFAVSGLHVGMAALLILWALRFLPFKLRCFTAAVGVWGYVLLTGAAVPALRAGFMIGMFLIFRGMLLMTPPLRLMGLAAGIIIIADPEALKAAGFQYSFLITAALLLLSEKLQTERQLEGRLFTIMPRTSANLARRRWFNGGFALRAMILSGCVAVLAGSVVSLFHNMALTPGAVIANWFTMPVLGILFAFLPLKLLASCTVSELDRLAARGIEGVFDYLRSVAEIMSELASPFYIVAPGIGLSILMAGLLLGALGLKNRKAALLAGVLFFLVLLSFPFKHSLEKSKVTVISSDSSVPATVVISDRGLGELILVDPVREHNKNVEEVLKSSGLVRICEVRFSEPKVRNVSGLHHLAQRYQVDRVFLPALTGKNWQFSDRITERKGDFYYAQEGNGEEKLRLFREKNKFAIEYPDSGVMLGWRLEISDRDNGRAVRFVRRGKESSVTLPWSNKNGVWHYEL